MTTHSAVCFILLVALMLSTTANAFLPSRSNSPSRQGGVLNNKNASPHCFLFPVIQNIDVGSSFENPILSPLTNFHDKYNFATTTLMSLTTNTFGESGSTIHHHHYHQFDDDSLFQLIALTTATTLDFSGQVPDTIRNIGFGIVALLLFAAGSATFVAQKVVPEQLNNLALMVQEEKPEVWDNITSQLQDGERVRDRPDLMKQLTDTAMELMKDETEEELKRLSKLIRSQKQIITEDVENNGADDNFAVTMEALRGPIEEAVGCSIDEFVGRVEANKESKFLTPGRRELAELLQEEFGTPAASLDKE